VLYGGGVLVLVEIALLVYCVLNVITTPDDQVRNLPKLLWLLLVVVVPLVGGIAWLVAGRPQGPSRSLPPKGQGRPSAPGRPARATASAPDDDEDFLRGLRERAEQQRRRAAEQRRQQGDDPVTPG
jgi:hypothetical protein